MALVEIEAHGRVALLTLNRPEKLNAISRALEAALAEALACPDVSGAAAVVLTGAGRAFSAGADVTEFPDQRPGAIMRYYRGTGAVFEQVASLAQPTLAAMHGYGLGGGLELALACDFRIVEEHCVLGFPEVALGIVPSSGGLTRLVRAVGVARAKELMLLRPRFGAAEARDYGLVTEVVAVDAVGRAIELAQGLAELPPLAVAVAKRAAEAVPESSREAALLIEQLAYGMLSQTADADEAARAFIEKREPRFEGD